jgi:hypothetical protein
MSVEMTLEEYRRQFKDLIDRSMIITVLKCDTCQAVVARIDHPKSAKLDSSCDMHDHINGTTHSSFTVLKHLIVYMCQADKDLAKELMQQQKDLFQEFFKP